MHDNNFVIFESYYRNQYNFNLYIIGKEKYGKSSRKNTIIISAVMMFVEVQQFARLLPQIRSSVETSEIRTLENVKKSPISPHIPMDPIFTFL